jgi:hypothetical protein
MWRLWVLANHLRWYGLLEVGLAMRDGSYWAEVSPNERNFLPPADPASGFGGGDG